MMLKLPQAFPFYNLPSIGSLAKLQSCLSIGPLSVQLAHIDPLSAPVLGESRYTLWALHFSW